MKQISIEFLSKRPSKQVGEYVKLFEHNWRREHVGEYVKLSEHNWRREP